MDKVNKASDKTNEFIKMLDDVFVANQLNFQCDICWSDIHGKFLTKYKSVKSNFHQKRELNHVFYLNDDVISYIVQHLKKLFGVLP